MRYALYFLPVVGAICGGVLAVWYGLCRVLACSAALFAAGSACIPLLVTGGIHMDGYMDTVDALASHQSRERKLEIMKDPSCGAFAVIYCGAYLLLNVGFAYELYRDGAALLLCPVYVLSRALSAWNAVTMPSARRSGMLNAYTQHAEKRGGAAVMLLVAVGVGLGMIWAAPAAGVCGVLAACAALWGYRRMAMREFGGVTGDTAGFFLQSCELCCLLGLWLGGKLG